MQTDSCDFCGSSHHTPRYHLKDWMTYKPGEFTLVECNHCGLLFIKPQLSWEELIPYYPNEYHAYRDTQKPTQSSVIKKLKNLGIQRRIRAIKARSSGGRILDIGCATGEFLAAFNDEKDWDCFGVEPVTFAADAARKQTKAEIFEGTLLDTHFPDNYFDVVTLWDVLEHTSNPKEIINEIFRILKPGGLLTIRVPDPESLIQSLFGAYWIAFDAPRHLYNFPKKVLSKYLSENGFNSIENIFLNSEHYVFFGSVSALLYDKQKFFLSKLAYNIAYSSVARVLFAALFLPFSRLKIGSAPVYFSRKRNY